MPTALIIFDHVFLLILFLIALFFGVVALMVRHRRGVSLVSGAAAPLL